MKFTGLLIQILIIFVVILCALMLYRTRFLWESLGPRFSGSIGSFEGLIDHFTGGLPHQNRNLTEPYFGGRTYQNGGKTDPILHVLLDERNFHYTTLGVPNARQILKKRLKTLYPKMSLKLYVITKNSNMVDYMDEVDSYADRYDWDDILYIANTTFDTEKISKTGQTHFLRSRDDLLIMILASELLDEKQRVIIVSNDKFKDVQHMPNMPAFNAIRIDGPYIEKRHINPTKYRFNKFHRIIDGTTSYINITNDAKIRVLMPN